ncbi:MAG: lasso peptide biosynthesis B2 protein [Deltaproteobacteria bacterium]|nr:lasso peptide biosynthesis B2 protein [Deltaproteobacteria bacterium]
MGEPVQRPSDPASHGRYLLSPDVVLMPLEDGTAQLVDLDGSFFGLSKTAVQMLKGTLEMGKGDTVQRIAADYNADHDRVDADLTALLGTLRAKGLIRRSDDHLPAVRLRTIIALAISYPALRIVAPVRNQWLKALALLAAARLCFALAGWARTVEAWQKCLKRSYRPVANLELERLIDTIDRATRHSASHLPSIACKERALCCWFMLRSAGVPARLVMGMRVLPLSGHCWCQVDERILTDSPEHCKAYTPVICYDG